MKATELTLRLPSEDAEFLEAYAKQHATSVAEIITRYARRLQNEAQRSPHPANASFSGAVPASLDSREAYRQGMIDKHR